jgi:hypothetical protein
MNRLLAALPLLAAMSLCACTTEQAYGTGQAWQRNQCSRIPDKAEYDRCMSATNASYEAYKRQRETERK